MNRLCSPQEARAIHDDLRAGLQALQDLDPAVGAAAGLHALLVHPDVRLVVRRILEGTLPHMTVVSYNEVAQGVQLKSVGMVE